MQHTLTLSIYLLRLRNYSNDNIFMKHFKINELLMMEEAEVPQKKVLQKNKFRNGISRIKSMWRKSMLTKKLNENRMKMEKVKRKK